MVWITAASAALGIAGSVIKGFGNNAAIDAQNRAARNSYKLSSAQDNAQFTLGQLQQQTQYAWDRARTSQLRAVEAKAALDQANYGTQLIANASQNYEINREALFDQFVTQEALRGTQIALESNYTQAKLAADTGNAVGQYMRQVNDAGLQGSLFLQQNRNQMAELLGSMALDEQRDNLGWQLRKLEALESDSETRASSYVRQGGGNTAKRLSMQAAARLGGIYAELSLKADDRAQKLQLLNTAFTEEGSTQMARVALQSQDAVARMNYVRNRYSADSKLANDQLQKLTLPSFELSTRQYGRELKSLQLQTNSIYQRALTPYTQKEYLDPIKPLPGIAPMSIGPSMQQKQSGWSMFGSAVIAGAQGALKGAKRVSSDGGKTWRTDWM